MLNRPEIVADSQPEANGTGNSRAKTADRQEIHVQICNLQHRAKTLGEPAVAEALKLAAMLLAEGGTHGKASAGTRSAS